MRTTVNIDEDLYRRAKARASRTGRSVSQLIEDAVREALRPRRRDRSHLAPLTVYGGSGVMPGVDLTDPAALLDRMDEFEPLHALR